MNSTPNFFTNKKTSVSFVLSLFVFFIHFREFSVFENTEGLLQSVLDLMLTVTKVAVPLFFMISGTMFYRNYDLGSTFKKWKSRFFSLCIPYLVWNTAWLVLALLGNYTPLGALLRGVKASLSLKNILNGIFLYSYFEPFWFIFQLIILTALCPLIYLLLKNKFIGILVIIAFFLASSCGITLNSILFPSTNAVLFYLTGAWIGIHAYHKFTTRSSKKTALTGLAVFIMCCVFHMFADFLPQWCATTQIPLLVTLLSCFAFWISFDYFDMKKCPKYMTCSFLVYALHSFVGAVISKMLYMLMPSNQIGLLFIALITFSSTIIVICLIDRALDKYTPYLKRILTGR